MKDTLLFILFILSVVCTPVSASEIEDYKNMSQLPIKELYQKGIEMENSQTDTALKYFMLAANKYSATLSSADKFFCAQAYAQMSDLQFRDNNYQIAFENALKGLKICEDNAFENLLPLFYKTFGNIYDVYGDSKMSLLYYEKGLELAKKHKLSKIEARTLTNLCMTNTTEGDFEKARYYYDLMVAHPFQDSIMTYFKYFDIAYIKAHENKHQEAITRYKTCLNVSEKLGLAPHYIAPLYGNIGQSFLLLGNADSALHYLRLSEKYTKEHHLSHFYSGTLYLLSFYYERFNNKEKADEYRKRYLEFSDSITNQREFNQLKTKQILYAIDKNNAELNKLSQETQLQTERANRQLRITLFIGLGLIAVICITFIIYRQKRKLQASYIELDKRNSTLIQSEIPLKNLSETNDSEPSDIDPGNTEISKDEQEASRLKIDDQQRKELLAQIKHIMEETTDYCDCDFSLEKLASAIGTNSKYVSQLINETYGKNFRTFINEYRIKLACLRLDNTEEYGNYTVQAIGESVGYKSRGNFTEIFKKHTGLTPAIYQKIAKSENGKNAM